MVNIGERLDQLWSLTLDSLISELESKPTAALIQASLKLLDQNGVRVGDRLEDPEERKRMEALVKTLPKFDGDDS